ncbi:uncharacterized protein LOC142579036 [Dermacentor variabilis]|uniref:uncharacterized protein LOC142579036 n=1 Tax=Dermacentor variabilis TaxID=34621 RepID=UPI003F5B5566
MAHPRQDAKVRGQPLEVSQPGTPALAAGSPPWSGFQSPLGALGSPPVLPAAIVARRDLYNVASAYVRPSIRSPVPARQRHGQVNRASPSILPASVAGTTDTSPVPHSGTAEDARRYAGFPGVPAYVLAPDVIIFTPRQASSPLQAQPGEPLTAEPPSDIAAARAAATTDDKPSPTQPPLVPPPGVESNSEDQARGRARTRLRFTQAWALCVVTIGTLMMPAGLVMLSYMKTPPVGRNTARSRSFPVSTVSWTHVPSPPHAPGGSTSWPALPSNCTEAPQLRVQMANVQFQPNRPFHLEPIHTVFCIYNVTRFQPFFDQLGQTYAPQNMPLEYCRNIVYWSMAVGADQPESRAPEFDDKYGMAMLRRLLGSSRSSKPKKLLVALGGYQSDSVRLTEIARDQRQMASFVKNVVEVVRSRSLNGVALHWVRLGAACRATGRDDDLSTVSAIADAISKGFSANIISQTLVTLLLPADHAVAGPLVNGLVNVVDYVIVETHLLPLPSVPSHKLCTDLADQVTRFIQSLSLTPEQEMKVCSGYSLSPLKVSGEGRVGERTRIRSYDVDSILSGRRARGKVSDVCGNKTEPCHYYLLDSDCFVVNPHSDRSNVFYLFHARDTLQAIVSHDAVIKTRRNVSSDRCAALFDLDMDNWDIRHTCKGFNLTYMHLMHFHASVEGFASPFQYLHRCQSGLG